VFTIGITPPRNDENRTQPRERGSVEKYAALAGLISAELLNRYFSDNMVALFENLRTGDLESHLCSLEFHTRVDAERVVAWMEIRVTERSHGAYWFEAEIFEDEGIFWIETTTTVNGLS
jgi:hypothetical protein